MPRACPEHLPERCFKNIDEDEFAAQEFRDAVIAELRATTNLLQAAAAYDHWRSTAKALGAFSAIIVVLEPHERLGRLRYRDSYQSTLADLLRNDTTLGGADESDISELLAWLLGETADIEDETAQVLFDLLLADRPIEPSEGWYFRTDDHGQNPFSGYDLSCLPWRLGLPFVVTGSKYVGFSVSGSDLEGPRRVTFADVAWDYHPYWRPNGRTEARSETPAACEKTGLEELLAKPPKFSSIRLPLVRVAAG